MGKYYVVIKGKETGIFDNWNDCQKATQKVNGALYSSVESREEANILWENCRTTDEAYEELQIKSKLPDDVAVLFIAGSCHGITNYAGVIVTNDAMETYSGSTNTPYVPNGRNGEGEMDALTEGLNKAVYDYGALRVIVVNQCNSTLAFAKGLWKPKNGLTEDFVNEIDECFAEIVFASDSNPMRESSYNAEVQRLVR